MRTPDAVGRVMVALAVAATSLVAPAASGAQTSPARSQPHPLTQQRPEASLLLTVAPERSDGTSGSVARRAILHCAPDGGTHRSARAACGSLRAVEGDFARLPRVEDAVCTMEYAPVAVSAIGFWQGRLTTYSATFNNRCVAGVETHHVFAF